MKYAVVFFFLGGILVWLSRMGGLLSLWFLWPAACAVAIAVSYLFCSPIIFGKLKSGRLSLVSTFLLFPYLAFTWSLWHLVRLLSNETPYNRLDEQTTIGRRLLASEFPTGINNVVDLTAEFSEPIRIVSKSNYLSFPVLDASIVSASELNSIVTKIDQLDGVTYIHCAQGHGRTGFVTAALLIHRNPDLTVNDAIKKIQRSRPALTCNRRQVATLEQWRASR